MKHWNTLETSQSKWPNFLGLVKHEDIDPETSTWVRIWMKWVSKLVTANQEKWRDEMGHGWFERMWETRNNRSGFMDKANRNDQQPLLRMTLNPWMESIAIDINPKLWQRSPQTRHCLVSLKSLQRIEFEITPCWCLDCGFNLLFLADLALL